MSRRRLDTEGATTVITVRGKDDDIAALLLQGLDGHAGPARRLPAKASAAMVRSILDEALKDGPLTRAEPEPATGAARRGPRRTLALLAAAVVVAASVGAAAAVLVSRELGERTARRAPPAPAHAPRPAPAETVPAEPEEIEFDEEVPAEIEMEPATIRRPTPPRPRPERPTALADDAPAEDVLALANQRRKEQDWRGADELYRRVVKKFPRTDAAVVAEIASATLHLSQLGDASGALRGYRHALETRPRGPLAEEARWGIAEAHRARGDRTAEYAALTDFLRAHPSSALAPAAIRRQSELAELRRAPAP